MSAIPNQYGVFEPDQCEILAMPVSKAQDLGPLGVIHLAVAADGYWRCASSYDFRGGRGGGGWPQADGEPFPTREEALSAAAGSLSVVALNLLSDRSSEERLMAAGPSWMHHSITLCQVEQAKRLLAWARAAGEGLLPESQEQLALGL